MFADSAACGVTPAQRNMVIPRERPSTRNSFTEPNGSKSSGCAISRRACFFMPLSGPGASPGPGLYIMWGRCYRGPRPSSTAADDVTVRSGAAHAENVPGGKSPAIWGELSSAAKAAGRVPPKRRTSDVGGLRPGDPGWPSATRAGAQLSERVVEPFRRSRLRLGDGR